MIRCCDWRPDPTVFLYMHLTAELTRTPTLADQAQGANP